MITVSGGKDRSLLHWRQNRNNSNVYETSFGGNALCLKDDYLGLFRGLEERLKAKTATSFVSMWKDAVAGAERAVRDKVRAASGCSGDSADSVAMKFRGNAAEIFAEKLFETGQAVLKPGTYRPVDPHNERGVDATAVSAVSGLTVGIQVKNYAREAVPLQVFRTAGDESDRYAHTLSPDSFAAFLTHPNQYILSFTEAEQVIKDEYEGRVGFLGPSWIDSVGLQGKKGERCGRWILFKEIADEIERIV